MIGAVDAFVKKKTDTHLIQIMIMYDLTPRALI